MQETDAVRELKTREKTEPIASFLGMKLEELTSGYARVTMTLKEDYVNFNDYIFGGIIMSLADQAFAYATNSMNLPSVASQVNIYFLSAPKPGDELTGECRVLKSGKRSAVSEMTVTGKDGKLIAKATGTTIPLNTA
jgi:acyl-CoA thioesterase